VPVFLTPISELQPLEILPKPIEIHLPDSKLEPLEAPATKERAALKLPI
jgi:hypothetical protein